MVRTSGIREKICSRTLTELAKRGVKRGPNNKILAGPLNQSDSEHDDNDSETDHLEQERRNKRSRQTKSSLLSILPEPKHSSSFGPTIKLDELLKMPERADEHLSRSHEGSPTDRPADGEMLEVDVSKLIGDTTPNIIKDLTIEKSQPDTVILPKGKEKQKNQITYLAVHAKAHELERKERAAQGRNNQAAARSKYGW